MTQRPPESVRHEQWLEQQPDPITVLREVGPYVSGLLGLFEKTSNIETYEEVKRLADRIDGAILKQVCMCETCKFRRGQLTQDSAFDLLELVRRINVDTNLGRSPIPGVLSQRIIETVERNRDAKR